MEGEDGPWIVQLSEDQATAAEVLPFLGEVTALACRARQAGERLYCWICL